VLTPDPIETLGPARVGLVLLAVLLIAGLVTIIRYQRGDARRLWQFWVVLAAFTAFVALALLPGPPPIRGGSPTTGVRSGSGNLPALPRCSPGRVRHSAPPRSPPFSWRHSSSPRPLRAGHGAC
jgi:hypothetical protein